ncbi:MAG: VWA domain-containing protein [Burkholderiales bacterium]|nr:VWA domain-containing protein [Burkholderiales bacterium]
MQGPPIEEAKRCAQFVVDRLRPDDRVALVTFNTRVDTLVPALPRGDGQQLREAIAGIVARGSTNLHGGWAAGAAAFSGMTRGRLQRVVLLSDGRANEGVIDTDAIVAQAREWAQAGITTSTYGLGDNFNEVLMSAMAQAGRGNAYYGATAVDLMDPFRREFDLLDDLALRHVRLRVPASDGRRVTLRNPYPLESDGWVLPDLPWGAETWAMLHIDVDATCADGAGSALEVARIEVTATDVHGVPIALEPVVVSLPLTSAEAWAALPVDTTVTGLLVELDAAGMLAQMYALAIADRWAEVHRLLGQAQERFKDHPDVSAVLSAMRALAAAGDRVRFGKEAMYSSESFGKRMRSATPDQDADLGPTASYLRFRPEQGRGEPDGDGPAPKDR